MAVDLCNNLLVVEVKDFIFKVSTYSRTATMDLLHSPEYESYLDAQSGTLMHFHQLFGHRCFDTRIKLAKDPASEIRFTNTKREMFVPSARGKQSKQIQSKEEKLG